MSYNFDHSAIHAEALLRLRTEAWERAVKAEMEAITTAGIRASNAAASVVMCRKCGPLRVPDAAICANGACEARATARGRL